MLDRLEAAFTSVTRFTPDASHELRTPITVVRTTAEVILERDRSPEEIREMVGLILREAEATSSIIEQLLTLARADAGAELLQLEPLILRDVVQEIDAAGIRLAEAHGVKWKADVSELPVVVLGDLSTCGACSSSIENACRYTAAGGSVCLRLSVQEDKALIEVRDTGIGIPAEELTIIFTRLHRASNARFFDLDGTGLGLPIAQWIAFAYGATLEAESTLGSGTSMSVLVPARRTRD